MFKKESNWQHQCKHQLDMACNQPLLDEHKEQLQQLFQQHLNIELNSIYFDAAEKMITGVAVDFSACPGSYISVLLAACLLSQKGIDGHVVFMNDELASYRASSFQPVFSALGVEIALVQPDMGMSEKWQAYQAPMTFSSVREMGLDYLRFGADQPKIFSSKTPTLLDQVEVNKPSLEHLCKVTLFEDVGLIMVDSMMTPLQISDDKTQSIIAVASFNKLFKQLPKIGGASPFLDKFSAKDLHRYGVNQQALEPFRKTCQQSVQFFSNDSNRMKGLSAEIRKIDTNENSRPTVCLIDQFSKEQAEQLQAFLPNDNFDLQGLSLDEVLTFFQSNDKLPQQGVNYVYVEESLAGIVDVTDQFYRIQGVDIIVLSVGVNVSARIAKRRAAFLAGMFDCEQTKSFLTVQQMFKNENSLTLKFLKCLPQVLNQQFLPSLLLVQQKYSDYKRYSANKALLVYEKEIDDLLAFSG